MFRRLFLVHPHTIGESYSEHLSVALGFAGEMIGAGLACLVHAIVPALFVTTGSKTIDRLHQSMVLHRRRRQVQSNAAVPEVKGSSPT